MLSAFALLLAAGLIVLLIKRQLLRKELSVDRYDWLAQRSAPPYCPMQDSERV